MALSIWHDGDLLCEEGDLTRLFREYPSGAGTMMVMSEDDWETVYFSKPFIYPLFIAPVVGLLGANGILSLNMLLLCGMIWMGARYLEQFNGETTSLLFSLGFFLLSPVFAYSFWIHPEVFDMAAVTVAFFLVVMPRTEKVAGADRITGFLGSDWRSIASALTLSLATFNKPLLAAMALPLLFLVARRQSRRAVAAWLLTMIFSSSVLLGVSFLWSEQAWPYLGVPRKIIQVSNPVNYVEERLPVRGIPSAGVWVNDTAPEATPGRLLEDAQYFLWGRHVGMLFYMPLAGVCVGLFLLSRRRSVFRWILLFSLAFAALLLLISVPGNWHGGADFIGNRYFIHIYPAFLFLATRIQPAWVTPLACALSAIFLGPILVTPFGPPVAHAEQSHVRQAPFRWLPLEFSLLDWIPNYDWAEYPPAVRFRGRRDVFQVHGQEMWLLGGSDLDLWITSPSTLPDAVFQVRSVAPGNRVEVCLQGDCNEFVSRERFPASMIERVTLRPKRPHRTRHTSEGKEFVYRLRVSTRSGEKPRWRGAGDSDFYLGAGLLFLGTSGQLDADVYSAEWLDASLPTTFIAGDTMTVFARLQNTSPEPWPSWGPTAVRVAYHWLDSDGRVVIWDGLRTRLTEDVVPNAAIDLSVAIEAPAVPGEYELALELVRENVAWFSQRGSSNGPRSNVEVLSPPSEIQPPSGSDR
jgi:hypothetical protein